jgi:hypothetical protein
VALNQWIDLLVQLLVVQDVATKDKSNDVKRKA